jgi:hypothetical protein
VHDRIVAETVNPVLKENEGRASSADNDNIDANGETEILVHNEEGAAQLHLSNYTPALLLFPSAALKLAALQPISMADQKAGAAGHSPAKMAGAAPASSETNSPAY